MTNTPTPRPDVEGIAARAKAANNSGFGEGPVESFLDHAWEDIPALIAYIKALEARMGKLEMFVRMARERGQLENAIAYLDENGKALAALGDGDG